MASLFLIWVGVLMLFGLSKSNATYFLQLVYAPKTCDPQDPVSDITVFNPLSIIIALAVAVQVLPLIFLMTILFAQCRVSERGVVGQTTSSKAEEKPPASEGQSKSEAAREMDQSAEEASALSTAETPMTHTDTSTKDTAATTNVIRDSSTNSRPFSRDNQSFTESYETWAPSSPDRDSSMNWWSGSVVEEDAAELGYRSLTDSPDEASLISTRSDYGLQGKYNEQTSSTDWISTTGLLHREHRLGTGDTAVSGRSTEKDSLHSVFTPSSETSDRERRQESSWDRHSKASWDRHSKERLLKSNDSHLESPSPHSTDASPPSQKEVSRRAGEEDGTEYSRTSSTDLSYEASFSFMNLGRMASSETGGGTSGMSSWSRRPNVGDRPFSGHELTEYDETSFTDLSYRSSASSMHLLRPTSASTQGSRTIWASRPPSERYQTEHETSPEDLSSYATGRSNQSMSSARVTSAGTSGATSGANWQSQSRSRKDVTDYSTASLTDRSHETGLSAPCLSSARMTSAETGGESNGADRFLKQRGERNIRDYDSPSFTDQSYKTGFSVPSMSTACMTSAETAGETSTRKWTSARSGRKNVTGYETTSLPDQSYDTGITVSSFTAVPMTSLETDNISSANWSLRHSVSYEAGVSTLQSLRASSASDQDSCASWTSRSPSSNYPTEHETSFADLSSYETGLRVPSGSSTCMASAETGGAAGSANWSSQRLKRNDMGEYGTTSFSDRSFDPGFSVPMTSKTGVTSAETDAESSARNCYPQRTNKRDVTVTEYDMTSLTDRSYEKGLSMSYTSMASMTSAEADDETTSANCSLQKRHGRHASEFETTSLTDRSDKEGFSMPPMRTACMTSAEADDETSSANCSLQKRLGRHVSGFETTSLTGRSDGQDGTEYDMTSLPDRTVDTELSMQSMNWAPTKSTVMDDDTSTENRPFRRQSGGELTEYNSTLLTDGSFDTVFPSTSRSSMTTAETSRTERSFKRRSERYVTEYDTESPADRSFEEGLGMPSVCMTSEETGGEPNSANWSLKRRRGRDVTEYSTTSLTDQSFATGFSMPSVSAAHTTSAEIFDNTSTGNWSLERQSGSDVPAYDMTSFSDRSYDTELSVPSMTTAYMTSKETYDKTSSASWSLERFDKKVVLRWRRRKEQSRYADSSLASLQFETSAPSILTSSTVPAETDDPDGNTDRMSTDGETRTEGGMTPVANITRQTNLPSITSTHAPSSDVSDDRDCSGRLSGTTNPCCDESMNTSCAGEDLATNMSSDSPSSRGSTATTQTSGDTDPAVCLDDSVWDNFNASANTAASDGETNTTGDQVLPRSVQATQGASAELSASSDDKACSSCYQNKTGSNPASTGNRNPGRPTAKSTTEHWCCQILQRVGALGGRRKRSSYSNEQGRVAESDSGSAGCQFGNCFESFMSHRENLAPAEENFPHIIPVPSWGDDVPTSRLAAFSSTSDDVPGQSENFAGDTTEHQETYFPQISLSGIRRRLGKSVAVDASSGEIDAGTRRPRGDHGCRRRGSGPSCRRSPGRGVGSADREQTVTQETNRSGIQHDSPGRSHNESTVRRNKPHTRYTKRENTSKVSDENARSDAQGNERSTSDAGSDWRRGGLSMEEILATLDRGRPRETVLGRHFKSAVDRVRQVQHRRMHQAETDFSSSILSMRRADIFSEASYSGAASVTDLPAPGTSSMRESVEEAVEQILNVREQLFETMDPWTMYPLYGPSSTRTRVDTAHQSGRSDSRGHKKAPYKAGTWFSRIKNRNHERENSDDAAGCPGQQNSFSDGQVNQTQWPEFNENRRASRSNRRCKMRIFVDSNPDLAEADYEAVYLPQYRCYTYVTPKESKVEIGQKSRETKPYKRGKWFERVKGKSGEAEKARHRTTNIEAECRGPHGSPRVIPETSTTDKGIRNPTEDRNQSARQTVVMETSSASHPLSQVGSGHPGQGSAVEKPSTHEGETGSGEIAREIEPHRESMPTTVDAIHNGSCNYESRTTSFLRHRRPHTRRESSDAHGAMPVSEQEFSRAQPSRQEIVNVLSRQYAQLMAELEVNANKNNANTDTSTNANQQQDNVNESADPAESSYSEASLRADMSMENIATGGRLLDLSSSSKRRNCCRADILLSVMAWVMILATAVFCSYLIIVSTLQIKPQEVYDMRNAFFLAWAFQVFLLYPLLVLASSLTLYKRPVDVYIEDRPSTLDLKSQMKAIRNLKDRQRHGLVFSTHYPFPISGEKVRHMAAQLSKRINAKEVLKETLMYAFFLIFVTIGAYGHISLKEIFRINKHLEGMLLKATTGGAPIPLDTVKKHGDILDYVDKSLLEVFYPPCTDAERRAKKKCIFTLNRDFVLLGRARIRQVRQQDDEKSCPGNTLPPIFAKNLEMEHCLPVVTILDHDDRHFLGNWSSPMASGSKTRKKEAWTYHSSWTTKEPPFWGKYGGYDGGGYVVKMPESKEDASQKLKILKESGWIDGFTRAIFITFNLYAPDSDYITSVQILFELTEYGNVASSAELTTTKLHYYNGWLAVFVLACEIAFALMTFGYTWDNIEKVMTIGAMTYFSNLLNWPHVGTVVFGLLAIFFHLDRLRSVHVFISSLKMSNYETYVSFAAAAMSDRALHVTLAFLCFSVMMNLVSIMQFFPYIKIFTKTFTTSRAELANVSIALAATIACMSYGSYLVFVEEQYGFRTLLDSFMTMFGYTMGVGATIYTDHVSQLYTIAFLVVFTLKIVLLSLVGAIIMEGFEVTRQLEKFDKEEPYILNYIYGMIMHKLRLGPKPTFKRDHADLSVPETGGAAAVTVDKPESAQEKK